MTRRFVTIAVVIIASATQARSEVGCLSPKDLSWYPSLVRHFAAIDTAGKGCVEPEQIARYKAAVQRDKAGQDNRIKAALAIEK